jgi:CheY-like chemotaxis protein
VLILLYINAIKLVKPIKYWNQKRYKELKGILVSIWNIRLCGIRAVVICLDIIRIVKCLVDDSKPKGNIVILNFTTEVDFKMTPSIKRIIMADDDDDDLEIFALALFEVCPDIELITAMDGAELLAILEKVGPPDMIVLDINMPTLGGKKCLEIIRSKSVYDAVKIMILSTSNSPGDIEYFLASGANNYYEKPTTMAAIKAVISEICKR